MAGIRPRLQLIEPRPLAREAGRLALRPALDNPLHDGHMRVSTLLFALLASVVAVGAPCVAQAQQGGAAVPPTRVPVTVVVADDLPGGAPFQVLRRADKDPRDVILLSRTADAAAFSEAVEQLILLRQAQGDTASVSGVMRVRRSDSPREMRPRVLPWADRVLGDLHRAPPRLVDGVGTLPAVEIWLPPQRGRQRKG